MPGSPLKFISYCSRESESFGPSQDECVGLSGKSTITFQSHEAFESFPLLETKRTRAFLNCRQWASFLVHVSANRPDTQLSLTPVTFNAESLPHGPRSINLI